MAITQIAEEQISTIAFTELADSILQSMVTQTGGAFEIVMDKFKDYLDNSALSGVDDVQKAAAYAQFTKDVYSDINKQALTSAMDLLKSNAQLSYEKWKVEADYNFTNAQTNKMSEEQGLIALTKTKMEKENAILDISKVLQELQVTQQRAVLKKQYGVAEQMTMLFSEPDAGYMIYNGGMYQSTVDGYGYAMRNDIAAALVNPSYEPHTFTIGAGTFTRYFSVRSAGVFNRATAYTQSEAAYASPTSVSIVNIPVDTLVYDTATNKMYKTVVATNNLGATGLPTPVFTDIAAWVEVFATTSTPHINGVEAITTIPDIQGIKAVFKTTTNPSVVISDVPGYKGAIDKQILGYDHVNYKDVLKTMDERAALMQNAKIPETSGEKAARIALIRALTTGVADMPATLGKL